MTNEDQLLSELKRAAEPAPPPKWQPGVKYSGRIPTEIVTPPMPEIAEDADLADAVRRAGIPIPDGYTLVLVEMVMAQHQAFWQRDPVTVEGDRNEAQGEAYTAPSASWRYRFKVVPGLRSDGDIKELIKEAIETAPMPRCRRSSLDSKIVNLADFQTGKVDILGGTAELLQRSETALQHVRAAILKERPAEIILVDPGDSTEGFESAPNAAQMNDLFLTEQIRVWRRILWRWIKELAPLAPSMKVISVPSNHCRVRKGKNAQGGTLDDWGIEVLAQVADIAAENPKAYGHVSFHIPEEFREHVLIQLVGGKTLAVAHGHQVGSANALMNWAKSQPKDGVGGADIVIVGHFHHLRVIGFGSRQFLFVCPTMDGGSSWYTPSSGEESDPAVLSITVTPEGWDGRTDLAWAA